jgi:hypothetical protein
LKKVNYWAAILAKPKVEIQDSPRIRLLNDKPRIKGTPVMSLRLIFVMILGKPE